MTLHQHHTSDGADAIADQSILTAHPFTTATLPPGAEPADGVDLEYRRLFASFGQGDDGHISRKELFSKLHQCGILVDDPRIQETVRSLRALDEPDKITFAQFKQIARQNSSLIKRAVQGAMAIPDFPELVADLKAIYESLVRNDSGAVASYIPQLGRINPEQFAIAICTVDGQRFAVGDSAVDFCLQSVSKPINYCLALEEYGEAVIHRHVGREPSGRGFNELSLNKDGLPHNPLINSGAIMTCSLVAPTLDLADRFDRVSETWSRLTGGTVGFNN